ncbi:hypothetical protein COO60DRAFT_579237 [Scenedesmus sp. NREL 46B-D3]|nr:hypothetical protein COO60DRAFT_579237 [Scenedesmus sp. NREL 46B-D3]
MARPLRFSTSKLLGSGAALASLGFVQALGSLQFKTAVGVAGRNTPAHSPAQAAVLLPHWVARSLAGMAVWLLLLVLVRVASPDVQSKGFPDACPFSKQLGCSRVARDKPHRAAGLRPVEMPTTLPAATSAVLEWIRQQPRATVLTVHRGPSGTDSAASGGQEAAQQAVAHARFVSLLWGFADDVFVRLSCDADNGAVLLEAQGQLRVGVGDMEVNVKRNAALLAAMEAEVKGGQLPAGPCSAAPVAGAA